MKWIARMAHQVRRRFGMGADPKVVERDDRGAMKVDAEARGKLYLDAVAQKFDLAPEEVLRKGVALFEIAADAELKGQTVAVLNRDNTVAREFTDFQHCDLRPSVAIVCHP